MCRSIRNTDMEATFDDIIRSGSRQTHTRTSSTGWITERARISIYLIGRGNVWILSKCGIYHEKIESSI